MLENANGTSSHAAPRAIVSGTVATTAPSDAITRSETRGDPDSASAQFFINVADNANLDYPKPDGNGYAVFGKVVEGMDVVDKIKAAPTESRGSHQNVPVTPITVKTARIVK
jgi:cyclophilin family peptidyl-prolyl cis-trans isomerase